MSYITTFSGKRFDPVEPDETLIDIAEVICKCENPQNVETEFVSLAANV